jgi:hypothetical protein
LLISVAVNLLVLGAIGAALVGARHGVGPLGGPLIGNPNLVGFLRTLPADRREDIWRRIAAERTALFPMRKQMRKARDDMHLALTRDPFDKDRFAAALKAYDDTEAHLRRTALPLISSIAQQLTAEERRAYVQWQAQHRRWMRRGRPPHPDAEDAQPAEITPSSAPR